MVVMASAVCGGRCLLLVEVVVLESGVEVAHWQAQWYCCLSTQMPVVVV